MLNIKLVNLQLVKNTTFNKIKQVQPGMPASYDFTTKRIWIYITTFITKLLNINESVNSNEI